MTTLQQITYAKLSQELAANYIAKGSLFGKKIRPDLAKILYMERMAVEWLYRIDPTNSTIVATGNYLYSLCAQFGLQAQAITAGGGSVSPVTPVTPPTPYEFIVDPVSFIPSGTTTKTIDAFRGFNLLFFRNNIPQSTVDTGSGGSFYSWNSATAVFVCNPAAVDTELFQLYALI